MEIGDRVRLNQRGENVKVECMSDWKGTIIEFRGDWVKVLWDEASADKCKSCGGVLKTKTPWEEHSTHLEVV